MRESLRELGPVSVSSTRRPPAEARYPHDLWHTKSAGPGSGWRARPERGRAGPRLACATALALTAALVVAGCASAPADTTASSANAGGAPALTQATALQAFDAYVAASNQAAATNDGKLALSVVTGAQQSLVSATLNSHAVSSTSGDTSAYSSTLSITPALVQYAYGAPTFYLPEPSGYPRFFLADVTRALAVKSASPAARTRPPRSAGPRCRSTARC